MDAAAPCNVEIPLGSDLPVPQIVAKTFANCAHAQAPRVKSTLSSGKVIRKEHKYGPEERHRLDLFLPGSARTGESAAPLPAPRPLVVFVHGGGLNIGDKRQASAPSGSGDDDVESALDGVLFGNVGCYFVERGYAVANINYRLVSPQQQQQQQPSGAEAPSSSSSQARFPSGGEDVALALQYLSTSTEIANVGVNGGKVFLFGTSAGAFHIGTYLWHLQRSQQQSQTETATPGDGVLGFICANLPARFDPTLVAPPRMPTMRAYFGSEEAMLDNDAISQRARSSDNTPTLLLVSSHDLPAEVTEPNHELVRNWKQGGSTSTPQHHVMQGHNHFSPAAALGLGGKVDEWAETIMLPWMAARLREVSS